MYVRANPRIAELARVVWCDLATEVLRHGLHAVADAEHGHAELEHDRVCAWRRGVRHGFRTTGKNDPARPECADLLGAQIPGMKLAINAGLAHAPRDELRVLSTEIE